MYRIRFHGRGGQGIKTSSRLLGTALFLAGMEVQDAPRYGAERRGAPIFAYVRAAREPIAERGIIRRPDLVVVADDTLIPAPSAGVLAGISEHSVFLVRSHEPAANWRDRLNLCCRVVVLSPSEDQDRSGLPFVGAACAGAAVRLLGLVSEEQLEEAIRLEAQPFGEAAVVRNRERALSAYRAVAEHVGCVKEAAEMAVEAIAAPNWIELPFEEAQVAAPSIHAALTSERQPTGLWRTLRPLIDYERCNRCWWVCSSFCPDGAISVDQGRPEIDYDHCKGCLVCLVQCPPHAITAVPEHGLHRSETVAEAPSP